MDNKNLVWYVGYGSNMLMERFMCYINGGQFRHNGRSHRRCADATPPRAKMLYEIPYNMYYGNQSGTWDGKGVSFLETSGNGKAYGVAYLISQEQFEHIYKEENGGSEPGPNSIWYNMKIALGIFDSIPVMTFTNCRVVEKNEASEKYIDVLAEGLKENYTYLTDRENKEYLLTRNVV